MKPSLVIPSARCWLLALLALSVSTGACTSTVAQSDPSGDSDVTPSGVAEESHFVSWTEAARVTIVVGGVIDIDWTSELELKIIDADASTIGQPLFSLGLDGPQAVDDTTYVRVGVDIVGHAYAPGRHVISGTDEDILEGITSAVLFHVFRVKDPSLPITEENVEFWHGFYHRVQDCVLEIGAEALGGSLTCPEMADQDDVRGSVTMTWEVIDDAA